MTTRKWMVCVWSLFAGITCQGQTVVKHFNLEPGQTVHAVLQKGEKHVYKIRVQPYQTAVLRTAEGGINGANIECVWNKEFIVRDHIKKWGRQTLLVWSPDTGKTETITVQPDRYDRAYGEYSITFSALRRLEETDLLDDAANSLYALVLETAKYGSADSIKKAVKALGQYALGVTDPVIKGNICLLLGEVLLDEYDRFDAVRVLDTAKRCYEQAEFPFQIGECLHDLADCAYRSGDKNANIRLETKAEAIFDSLGDREMTAETLDQIGLSYGELDDTPRERAYFIKALQIIPDRESAFAGTIYNNIALLFEQQKRNDSAIFYFRKAAHLRQDKYTKMGRAQTLVNLAEVYRSNGKKDSAIWAIKEAIRIADNEKNIENGIFYRSQLAQSYYERKGKRMAVELLEQALSLSDGESSSTDEVHRQLSDIAMAEKNWKRALYHLAFQVRLRDRLWGLNLTNVNAKLYGESRLYPYYDQIRCYMELYKKEKDQRWSDSARNVAIAIKGRSFVLEQRLNSLPRSNQENQILKYVADSIARIYTLTKTNADKNGIYQKLLEGYSLALADKYSDYRAPAGDEQQMEVQPDNSVLFLLHSDQSYAWVMAGKRVYTYLLPDSAFFNLRVAKINAGIQLYYDLGTAARKEVIKRVLKEINDLSKAIRPVFSHLAGPGVFACRDGSIGLVPFQLLNLDTAGEYEPAIERYEFSYLPSFRYYQEVARKPDISSKDSLLVVSDPIYDSIFPRLVNSAGESMKIERYFGHYAGLKEGDATKENFVATSISGYNYIHFATHSLYDLNFPDLSNIALSCKNNAGVACNPLLFTFEIETLHLHPRLVVLGSCYSGFGKAFTTEGVLSLERAFLVAGASSVISANWSVDDQFSSDFFSSLYDYHLNGNFSVCHALRLAQLDSWRVSGLDGLLNWAAFTYTGVGR